MIRVDKTTVTVPVLVGDAAVSWIGRMPLDDTVELRLRRPPA